MKYWNFYPFEGKLPVKKAPYQERLATFLRVVLCSQAAILYSKYQFLSQTPQAQNTWCMPQLVYIDNWFPPQMCRKRNLALVPFSKPLWRLLLDYEESVIVPEILRARNSEYVMQTKERNERGGNGDAPVTSSGLGKEGSNFWWARKRKRLLAVYRLLIH